MQAACGFDAGDGYEAWQIYGPQGRDDRVHARRGDHLGPRLGTAMSV